MSQQSHIDDFLTPENFELAFKRLQTAQRNLYKELYYEDLRFFGFYLDQNIINLIDELEEKIFQPEKSYKIFIPKKDNRVRPLSLLKFKDLLVYQSIVNVIADSVYVEISPYYNSTLFGNVISAPNELLQHRIFFYKPWKEQWKKFSDKTKQYYDSGYTFLSEFDIASFFDTIDHGILYQILLNTYNIDKELLEILTTCLESWTGDSSYETFQSKHGIPQGPISSAFLADLYLLHLDLEFGKVKKMDVKYIRYVDDIRIFSRDKITAQKSIAYLDLLARDLGLIPQGSKILISEIDDINQLLRHQRSKFSLISKEYKRKGNKLKKKTHRKLKKRFLDCFDDTSGEMYLDKTIISFSLYKLNKDADVKNKILEDFEKVYTHFSAILSYLRKHFSEDQEVREWLVSLIKDEDLLFHYVIALIFKSFPDLPFMEDVYQKYICQTNRNWLVSFFMVNWLYHNEQEELILSNLLLSHQSENYFLNRELNNYRNKVSKRIPYKRLSTISLLKNKDSLTALQGMYLNPSIAYRVPRHDPEYNSYVQHILSHQKPDYINYALKEKFSIPTPENFFNRTIWDDDEVYVELSSSFRLFNQFKDIDSSKSLLNLNLFNNLVFDKLLNHLNIPIPEGKSTYGDHLNAKYIAGSFPIANQCFIEVNSKRNQNTEAHSYDKYGNIRIKIKFYELNIIIKREILSLNEICKQIF